MKYAKIKGAENRPGLPRNNNAASGKITRQSMLKNPPFCNNLKIPASPLAENIPRIPASSPSSRLGIFKYGDEKGFSNMLH
jgi:hypothetical protein